MFTFFTIVFAIVWAVVSFILLFKVWDNIGPIVLSFSKSRHGYHLPHHLGRSRLALDEDFRVIHLQNNSQRRCKAAAFESQRLFLLAKVILRVFEFPLIFLNQKATFVLLTELHFGQLGKRLHWAQR